MSGATTLAPRALPATDLDALRRGRGVRDALPGGTRVAIERLLPFLCLYRRPVGREDPGSEALVTGVAAYAVVPECADAELAPLLGPIVVAALERYGGFLLLEVVCRPRADPVDRDEWPDERRDGRRGEGGPARGVGPRPARVRLRLRSPEAPDVVVRALSASLGQIDELGGPPEVRRIAGEAATLLGPAAAGARCAVVEIELDPPHYDLLSGARYPVLLRGLRRQLTRCMEDAADAFARSETQLRPTSPAALGRRTLLEVERQIDRELTVVGRSFEFLLAVTPTNIGEAWDEFSAARGERAPTFRYRPVPVDPELLQRRLFALPVEDVEDPVLGRLFREQRDELAQKLRMLEQRGTPRFLYGSLKMFPRVSERLLRLAEGLTAAIAPRHAPGGPIDDEADAEGAAAPSPEQVLAQQRGTSDVPGGLDGCPPRALTSHAFAARVRAELDAYRRVHPSLEVAVEVRDDLASVMVSQGRVLIPRDALIPAGRVEALVQHEVGTHVVTYTNGLAQPLHQLCFGLPGYQELQEALAVLAEYLVGGLTPSRLRLLAGRVIAVRHLVDGAGFVDVHRDLVRTHGFAHRTAFDVALRVFRGGGLTKDAIYLRGLSHLLEHLAAGEPLEPLFVGKLAVRHLRALRELTERGVLVPPPLRPRFLDAPGAAERVARLREGCSLLDLIGRAAP